MAKWRIPAEPEKMLTHPENQQVMPENKPENAANRLKLSCANELYCPDEPGPFSWNLAAHAE